MLLERTELFQISSCKKTHFLKGDTKINTHSFYVNWAFAGISGAQAPCQMVPWTGCVLGFSRLARVGATAA